MSGMSAEPAVAVERATPYEVLNGLTARSARSEENSSSGDVSSTAVITQAGHPSVNGTGVQTGGEATGQAKSPAGSSSTAAPAGPGSGEVLSAAGIAIPQPLPPQKEKPYQARERIRRIHLPVREGMDELSDDEGDGSEWALPTEEEKKNLPPGYDGKRRIRKPGGEPDGKIKPSYYYPTDTASRGVPVFEPTYEEFRDFNSFIAKIDNYGMRSGIVKVVPPKEWHNSLGSVAQPLKDTVIKDAIEQHFMGSRGQFRQSNIASRRGFSVKQWKEMCDSDKYQTPNFFNAVESDGTAIETIAGGRTTRSGRVARQANTSQQATPSSAKKSKGNKKVVKEESVAPSVASETSALDEAHLDNSIKDVDMDTLQNPQIHAEWEKRLEERVGMEGTDAQTQMDMQIDVKTEEQPESVETSIAPASPTRPEVVSQSIGVPSTPSLPAVDTGFIPYAHSGRTKKSPTEVAVTDTPNIPAVKAASAVTAPTPSPSVPPTSAKRKTMEEAQAEREKEFENFDYESLPWGAKPSDFTVDECGKIEKNYWQRFSLGAPPMYGADGSGSLFDESVKDWNVAALDDLLMRINPHMPMPGVNTPYLYFGMWRATFAWHVEDADLYSINYIHFGAPKFWYSVPQGHAERFERVMAGYFPRDQQKCSEFMRHKSFLVSPSTLAKDGIPLNKCVQFPGEIILTYPYGYHSGFNIGFNCAESINFATEGWLDIGRKARACVCHPDTVRINVDNWLQEAREDAERMRSDPAYAAYRKRAREFSSLVPQHEARKRRQMGPAYDQLKKSVAAPPPPAGQRTMQPLAPATSAAAAAGNHKATAQPQQTQSQPSASQWIHNAASSKKSSAARQQYIRGQYPCALCPELTTDGLVKVAGMMKNNKQVYAHKICVTFTPTTWCAIDPQSGEECVYGFEQIEKERWNLKCGLCDDKHGTKIQCTKSAKCVRAFHATCALKENSGVVLDALIGGLSVLEPVKPEETVPSSDGHLQLVVTCRQHNPVWMKAQNDKRKAELAAKVNAIPIGTSIQIRTTTGVWAVTLVRRETDQEGTIEIQFGNGEKALCKHGALVFPEEKPAPSEKPASTPKPRPSGNDKSKGSGTNPQRTQHQQPRPFQNNPAGAQQVRDLLASLGPEQQATFHQWYISTFVQSSPSYLFPQMTSTSQLQETQLSKTVPTPAPAMQEPRSAAQASAPASEQTKMAAASYPSPASTGETHSPPAEARLASENMHVSTSA